MFIMTIIIINRTQAQGGVEKKEHGHISSGPENKTSWVFFVVVVFCFVLILWSFQWTSLEVHREEIYKGKNAYSLVWQSAEGRADEKFGSVNRFRPFYSSSCEHSAWHSLDCPPCLCFDAGCGGQACTAGSILALELWAPGGREWGVLSFSVYVFFAQIQN